MARDAAAAPAPPPERSIRGARRPAADDRHARLEPSGCCETERSRGASCGCRRAPDRCGAVTQMPLATTALVRLGEITNRTFVLPVLIFYPTSRCNSRCASCDWWKCSGEGDLDLEEIEQLTKSLPRVGARIVVFSGGEPLLRPEVFDAARL